MLASELIFKLQEQIELHGDLEVGIRTHDGEFDCDFDSLLHEVFTDNETYVFEGVAKRIMVS